MIMNVLIYFTLYSSLLLGHIPTPVLDGLFLYCAIQTVYRGAFSRTFSRTFAISLSINYVKPLVDY